MGNKSFYGNHDGSISAISSVLLTNDGNVSYWGLAKTVDTNGNYVEYVYEKLGVLPESGGQHVNMGTHNRLLKLGESIYLEIIAVNPDSPNPDRHRWFSMDNLQPYMKPKLITWVVRTNNIYGATDKARLHHGRIESMQRGNYNWLITIPDDGEMPLQGIAPTIIQWKSKLHPAQNLPKSDFSLIRIEGYHPKANEINDSLADIGFNGAFNAISINESVNPFLAAFIKTPKGIVKLE